jgi:hypothetical protein
MKRILYRLKDNQDIVLVQDENTIDKCNLFICNTFIPIIKEKYENIKLSEAFLIIERDYGVKELFERNPFLEAVNKEKTIRLVVEDLKKEWGYYLYVIDLKTGKSTDDWHCESMDQIYLQASDYGVSSEDFKEIDFNKLPVKEER